MWWWYSRWVSDVPKVVCRRRDIFQEKTGGWGGKNTFKSSHEGKEVNKNQMEKNMSMVQINNSGRRKGQANLNLEFPFFHNGVLLKLPFSRHRTQPTHTNNRQTTSRAVCILAYRDRITNSDLTSSPVYKIQTTLHVKTATLVCHMQFESLQNWQDFTADKPVL